MAAAYSAQDKAVAVEIVQRFGGEVTLDALAAIRQALAAPKLNKTTVWRWVQAAAPVATGLQPAKTPAQQVAAERAEIALDDYFEQTARNYLAHANRPDVIEEVRGQQAITGAAIAVDKMRLLRGLPTEIISVLPEVLDAIQALGLTPADVFQAIIAEAAAKREYAHLDNDD